MSQTLAIIGPGTLGLSLASWAAQCGFDVRLAGRDQAHAIQALAEVERRWKGAVPKGRLTAHGSWEAALDGADIVFEALPENLDLKAEAWRRLGALARAGSLLLTGTSGLPVGRINAQAGLGGALLGFHLFVPVAEMKVVELIPPDGVSMGALEKAKALGQALQKRVVLVQDIPGFAASRLGLVQGLEAIRLLEQGVATAEDLDALLVLGYGHPIGQLELSDRVGLDVRLAIAESIHAETGDPRFEPPALLREMVACRRLGRKCGLGFYAWEQGRKRPCI